MTTTDAEAIARIMARELYNGATLEECTCDERKEWLRAANAILSYLASRREAELVAWRVTYADGGTVYLHHKPSGDSGVYECTPLYEHPSAGEVERLREALEIIAGERQCIDNLMSNADVARAALNGGQK